MTLTSDQTAIGITASMIWPRAKPSANGPSNGCVPSQIVLPSDFEGSHTWRLGTAQSAFVT